MSEQTHDLEGGKTLDQEERELGWEGGDGASALLVEFSGSRHGGRVENGK